MIFLKFLLYKSPILGGPTPSHAPLVRRPWVCNVVWLANGNRHRLMKPTRGYVLSCYWGKIKRRYDSTRDRCPDYYCYFPSQFPHAPLTSFPRGRNISPIIWHKKSQLPKQKNNTTVILTFFSNLELELWRCKTRPQACQCFACWLLQPVPRKQHLSWCWGETKTMPNWPKGKAAPGYIFN